MTAGQREALARSLVPVLRNSARYVHRRVELLTVPLPERPIYRRQLSVDFSIPPIEPVGVNADGSQRFLVPLSLISKWPPLLRFDLRSDDGRSLAFLTAEQTSELDAAVLVALASAVGGEALDPGLAQQFAELTRQRGPDSYFTLYSAIPLIELISAEQLDRTRLLLRNDKAFVALATQLAGNSLLWCTVDGRVGDRRIVKYALEAPWTRRRANGSFLASLSVAPFVVDFDLPHFGETESYHLTVTAPEPTRVVDAMLELTEPETPTSDRAVVLAHWTAHGTKDASEGIEVYAAHTETQARFYVKGDRTGAEGMVYVALEVDTAGFLNGAAGAAMAVAALLWLFGADMQAAVAKGGADAGTAVLLLGPVLLSYVLVRPREHVLVGGFLVNLRRMLILSGSLPVVGAAALALSHESVGKRPWLIAAAVLATLIAAVLLVVRAFPRGAAARPLSNESGGAPPPPP